MAEPISFYNTGGRYYNTSGNSTDAATHYYLGANRKCRFDITAEQMALITTSPSSITLNLRNQNTNSGNIAVYAFASLSSDWSGVDTHYGETATYIHTFPNTYQNNYFNITAPFKYAYNNWQGQAWSLWLICTSGNEINFIGYNHTSYDSKYAPLFTVNFSGATTPYAWSTEYTTYTYPAAAMTANSSQNCVASASSTYSSNYPAYKAFDYSTSNTPWICAKDATSAWLQLQMPEKLYEIEVSITNRAGSTYVHGMTTGSILGSVDGTTWETLVDITERDGVTAGSETSYSCNNSEGYDYIRIQPTAWNNGSDSANYCAIDKVIITGKNIPSTGGWLPVQPYLWTTAATSYTYPEAAMTSNSSQGCYVASSSVYSDSYPAWRAFDKSLTTAAFATTRDDADRWIGIWLPRALCDVSVVMKNRGDNDSYVNGPVSGKILGTNDNINFVEIGSYSERDGSTAKAVSTIQCSHATAYRGIKITITEWVGSMTAIGELEITGTDVSATEGGWKKVGLRVYNGEEWI